MLGGRGGGGGGVFHCLFAYRQETREYMNFGVPSVCLTILSPALKLECACAILILQLAEAAMEENKRSAEVSVGEHVAVYCRVVVRGVGWGSSFRS